MESSPDSFFLAATPTSNPFTNALVDGGYQAPANQQLGLQRYADLDQSDDTNQPDAPPSRDTRLSDTTRYGLPQRPGVPELETSIATLSRHYSGARNQVDETEQAYTLMLGNARNDDSNDINEAMQDARRGRALMSLFSEGFTDFMRTAQYEYLLAGQQAKWQPTIRDAHGRPVGGLPVCLLSPSLSPLTGRPVIAIVLPAVDYVARLAGRPLAPTQGETPGKPASNPDSMQHPAGQHPAGLPRQVGTASAYPSAGAFRAARESNRPLTWLERQTDEQQREALMILIETVASPAQQELPPKLAGETRIQATLDAIERTNRSQRQTQFDPTVYEQQLAGIGRTKLGLPIVEAALFGRQAANQSTLYRITYHPDIEAIGKQPIPEPAIPKQYKGVALQSRQIENLLLGHTVELTGIRDPSRGGLYRAGLHLNLLKGTTQETAGREEVKVTSKQEQRLHTQLTTGRTSDETRRSVQTDRQAAGTQQTSLRQQSDSTQATHTPRAETPKPQQIPR